MIKYATHNFMNVEECSQVDRMNKFQQIIMLFSLVQIYLTRLGLANDNLFEKSVALVQGFNHKPTFCHL
jgi:hypothetical protein